MPPLSIHMVIALMSIPPIDYHAQTLDINPSGLQSLTLEMEESRAVERQKGKGLPLIPCAPMFRASSSGIFPWAIRALLPDGS